ncbi:hypothetical protein WDZ92_28340 [Nostoc sp. NIES-2111]
MQQTEEARHLSRVMGWSMPLIVLPLVLAASAGQAADEGRYQVIASQVVGNKPVVLMWDTQTGRSWILRSCQPNAQGGRTCDVQWLAIDPNQTEAAAPH